MRDSRKSMLLAYLDVDDDDDYYFWFKRKFIFYQEIGEDRVVYG